VTITVAAGGGDTATATAIAAAINASADALVSGLVSAVGNGAVVTVTASAKGKPGNCVTLAATGTGVTASGARLTGGVDLTYTTFDRA
jgi:phage tail sheath gpL-like